MSASSIAWAETALGHHFRDPGLVKRALTHPSTGEDNYQRLEFLGDRVLGLVIARWLYELHADEPEGKLSRRLNALVTRPVCAEVAREIGLRSHMRLGKQAREDGAADSDNVLGDICEALIGALAIDGGLDAAEQFIRARWASRVEAGAAAPKHPKSSLQEWAAAHDLKAPEYRLVSRTGPHHAPKFEVEVSIKGHEPASATGTSKQEAETAAAEALLARLQS